MEEFRLSHIRRMIMCLSLRPKIKYELYFLVLSFKALSC